MRRVVVNINCHYYFKNGIIENDVELDVADDQNVEEAAVEYVKTTYGDEYYNEATEYGPLETKILYDEKDNYEDMEDLEV